MKRRVLALTDRLATWAFLSVLGYWKWRTGKPAFVWLYSPELARGQWERIN